MSDYTRERWEAIKALRKTPIVIGYRPAPSPKAISAWQRKQAKLSTRSSRRRRG